MPSTKYICQRIITHLPLGEEELIEKVSIAGQRQTASRQTDRIPILVMDDNRCLSGHESMLRIAALLCA